MLASHLTPQLSPPPCWILFLQLLLASPCLVTPVEQTDRPRAQMTEGFQGTTYKGPPHTAELSRITCSTILATCKGLLVCFLFLLVSQVASEYVTCQTIKNLTPCISTVFLRCQSANGGLAGSTFSVLQGVSTLLTFTATCSLAVFLDGPEASKVLPSTSTDMVNMGA